MCIFVNFIYPHQIYGTVVVMDFDGLSMKQVMGLSPAFSMRLLSFIQDAMPLRLKEVYIATLLYIAVDYVPNINEI